MAPHDNEISQEPVCFPFLKFIAVCILIYLQDDTLALEDERKNGQNLSK